MDPFARALMAGLAIFVVWTLVGAGRSGVIYSEGWSLDIDRSPALFGLCYLAHLLIVVMCLAFAAGYTPAELKQFAWAMTGAGR
jgi:hypothetical protein